ncbi:hypothetical protein SASPL_139409 [Salvia splendens]|uniref:LsmAD domain-containing protein n=1 Tax=Salvia splendens TaxID=180675 RepID=A0A8X8WQ11_SALSN|nr:hypothetical protein SASPL_139409 [Salvia splendens]
MNMQQVLPPRSSSNGYGHHKIEGDTATRFNSVADSHESNSCDRLIYLTTCLIGHKVEVQVQDGSLFSGIFHAISGEDYGVILKMACSVKNGSPGQKNVSDSSEPPSKTLIIPATDLVQIMAKDVPVIRDGFLNELQRGKQQELMTDSCISQSRNVEAGRELERWVPDEDDPGCPELENIFDGPWNRGWDQFEVNKTLFGVKSTFDEELYTTKLDRGPQMRELEREALKIAREIEGEQTLDLHLAEERGIQIDGNIEIDEETRFSSVYRGNHERSYEDIVKTVLEDEEMQDVGLSANATAFDPSRFSSKVQDKESFFNELPKGSSCPDSQGVATSLARTSSSASSASDRGGGTSTSAGRGLSPSSSVASLSSEKSTLNPHAKEFKFNANAKSFVPFQTPRPISPIADNSFYYPPMATATHMHGMPSGVGVSAHISVATAF